MKKKVVVIIQAHMSSTRLPGKVLLDIKGAPALYRMIERVKQCKYIDDIVIATSTLACDDILEEKCKEWGVNCFRGSDSDVLARYWGAAQAYPSDIYVRLTSDCPLYCSDVGDMLISKFLESDYRYMCAFTVPNGTDTEVFTSELLKEAYENATEGYEHEHVTPYMYKKQPKVYKYCTEENLRDYRITLDTPEDYELILAIYDKLYTPGNSFKLYDIVNLLKSNPDLLSINSKIKQKGLTD